MDMISEPPDKSNRAGPWRVSKCDGSKLSQLITRVVRPLAFQADRERMGAQSSCSSEQAH